MSAATASLSELDTEINNYLEYMEVEKGSSPLTIRNYKHYLSRFSAWMKTTGIRRSLKDINATIVKDFRVYLSRLTSPTGEPLSRKTQGYHAIALRSFLRWLIKTDHAVLSPDKIDLPKVTDRQVEFLSGEQVDRLLGAPTVSKIAGSRDKAILELLFSTGLRVSELASLDKDKMDFQRREFGVIGKGGKSRIVFLSSRASHWIQRYLDMRTDHFKPLFIRHKGNVDPATKDEAMRLTPRSIQRMVKKYARLIKLPVRVTPHVLRHSFATDLLMAGADIRSVQEMLGHKNIQTTQVYTHVTHKRLKEVHESYHGKGGAS